MLAYNHLIYSAYNYIQIHQEVLFCSIIHNHTNCLIKNFKSYHLNALEILILCNILFIIEDMQKYILTYL